MPPRRSAEACLGTRGRRPRHRWLMVPLGDRRIAVVAAENLHVASFADLSTRLSTIRAPAVALERSAPGSGLRRVRGGPVLHRVFHSRGERTASSPGARRRLPKLTATLLDVPCSQPPRIAREAHLPAQHAKARQDPWLSQAHEHRRRAGHHQAPPRPRPEAALGLASCRRRPRPSAGGCRVQQSSTRSTAGVAPQRRATWSRTCSPVRRTIRPSRGLACPSPAVSAARWNATA